MLLGDVKDIEVLRQGLEKHIALPADFGQMMVDSGAQRPFSPRYPTEVYALESGLPAELAGLQKGDRIVSVNDIEIPFFNDYLREMNNLKGQTVTLGYMRNGELAYTSADVNENGQLGFQRSSPAEFFEYAEVNYSLAQSIPAGYSEAREKLLGYIVSMKFLFSKSGASQMGGFVSIAKIFPDVWNWRIFWINTAWLSLILAFMNILPIPALDGGHVMFLLFEIISGRPPSQKVMERAQIIGIILLLSLLIFANGNDVFKLLNK
jgi:regulator of sigma E protease